MRCTFGCCVVIVRSITTIVVFQSTLCHAAPALDQQYEPPSYLPAGPFNQFNEDGPAQTFTVGVSGMLDRVDVLVHPNVRVGNLLVEIQNTTAEGKPFVSGATTLAMGFVPLSDLLEYGQGMTAIDLSASNLRVNEGDVLAIYVRRDQGGNVAQFGVAWYAGYTGREPEYAGGAAWEFFPGEWRRSESGRFSDYGFRTYVTPVPEPAAGMLALAAGGWLLRRRRMS